MWLSRNPVFCLILIANYRSNEVSTTLLPQGEKTSSDAGKPLFLTPLLKNNKKEEARNASKVDSFVGDVKSHSGFITVDKSSQKHLFFWFFECEYNPKSRPIIVWLPGGPGDSMMFPIFEENGPYELLSDDTTRLRNYRWTKRYNMLYFDAPAGAGFSYTTSAKQYSKTVQDAVIDIHEALTQFITIFDDYKNQQVYLAGENYAGKYVVELALRINEQNKKKNAKINLKDLVIGSPFIDPITQLKHSEYLFQFGIVDDKEKMKISTKEQAAQLSLSRNQRKAAKSKRRSIEKKIISTGYNPPIDVLEGTPNHTQSYERVKKYIQRTEIRKKIHVGERAFQDDKQTMKNFDDDYLNTVAPSLSTILNSFSNQVLLYSGQFDLKVPSTQIETVIENLNWNNLQAFEEMSRENWKIGKTLAGYKKSGGKLHQVMVRTANHYAIRSQPERMWDLITWFVQ